MRKNFFFIAPTIISHEILRGTSMLKGVIRVCQATQYYRLLTREFQLWYISNQTIQVIMKQKIIPLFDNVLVEPLEAETKTASGIILPDSAKEKPQVGVIRAVGKGKTDNNGKLVAMVVKVGDKVMYKKWGGNEIKVGGKEWTLISQDDILAIVN